MEEREVRSQYAVALDLMAKGNLDECAIAMEDLLKQSPDFLEAYEGLAVVYSHMNRLDDAIRLMKELAKKDPENIMAHTNLSIFYMKKGMKEEAEEEKAKATVLQFNKKPKDS